MLPVCGGDFDLTSFTVLFGCSHARQQGLSRDRCPSALPRDGDWVWKAGPIFDWRLLAAHPLPQLRYLDLSYAASMEHYAGNDAEDFCAALQWLSKVDVLRLPRTCAVTPLPTTTSDVGWSLRMAMSDTFCGGPCKVLGRPPPPWVKG